MGFSVRCLICCRKLNLRFQTSPVNADPVTPSPVPLPGTPDGAPLTRGDQPEGALSGKTVWLSAGHGWTWTGIRWVTQRPNTYGIVEDFSNAEAVNVITWCAICGTPERMCSWCASARRMKRDNRGQRRGVRQYRRPVNATSSSAVMRAVRTGTPCQQDESASATWKPDSPKQVCTRCGSGTGTAQTAPLMRVNHTPRGGRYAVSISQEVHGSTWRYLGEFYFEAGTGGYVSLTNESSDPGQALIADAVRFGGGLGSIDPWHGASGKPGAGKSSPLLR